MSIGGWIVFEYVSTSRLLFVFIILNIQLISYSIFVSKLFNSFTHLFLLTILIWIIINILSYKHFDKIYKIILFLNPHFSLINILKNIFIHERSMNDIYLNKILYHELPLFYEILLIILFSIPIYWIFIWYIEQISPG